MNSETHSQSPVVAAALPIVLAVLGWFLISRFVADFGYPAQMVWMHLSILLPLVSLVTFAALVLRFLPRAVRAGFVLVFLILLSAFYAAFFFSNRSWGDNITPGLISNFLLHDGHVLEKVKDFLVQGWWWGIVALILLLPVWWCLLRYISSGQRYFYSEKGGIRFVALSYLFVIVPLTVAAVLSRMQPTWFRGEPLLWAAFQWPMVLDIAGTDSFRKEALIADDIARKNYPAVHAQQAKNIIIIMLDSLRADRLPAYGYDKATTPFLSELESSGQLKKVDMALSTCSESFCGIASTLSSHYYHKIAPANFRLHEILKKAGYLNYFLLAGNHSEWAGLKEFYGSEVDGWYDYRSMHTHMHDDRSILKGLDELPRSEGKPAFIFSFLMSTHVLGERFDEFHHYQPDEMKQLVPLWSERSFSEGLAKVAPGETAPEALQVLSNNYDNGVLQADWIIRHFFDVLREKGYLDDAIVFVLGDHGESLGQHDHVGHNLFLYQQNMRIPLLIWTSKPQQLKNLNFAAQTEVAPTALEFAGFPVPNSWDGRSLISQAPPPFSVHQTRRGKRPCAASMRLAGTEFHKIIQCVNAQGVLESKLFNISLDPEETKDLWSITPPQEQALYLAPLDFFQSKIVNSCTTEDCLEK